jgi:CRP/FNR family transcriptional regulator
MSETAHCDHCKNQLCIHKVPIFSTLAQSDLLKISGLIHHREYKKGEVIFQAGDQIDSIIILNEGSAKAFKYTGDGREQILYVFSEGDFFGEQYLLSNQMAAYTIEALSPVKVCMLTKARFQELLTRYPNIGIKIIEELGHRMTRLENVVQSLGIRSVDARICSLLVDFSQKFGKEVPEGILLRLPLSREGLANYLGVARETVSRKLGQLETDGLIQSVSNKAILIVNMAKLKEYAE